MVLFYSPKLKGISMQDTFNLIVTIQDPDLNDEELQTKVQLLVPQIREIDGVEEAKLVSVDTAPMGAKSVGGFVAGCFQATVITLKLRPLWEFLGDRIANKTIEATFKSPDGREFTGKARNRDDFKYLLQQAEEFYKK